MGGNADDFVVVGFGWIEREINPTNYFLPESDWARKRSVFVGCGIVDVKIAGMVAKTKARAEEQSVAGLENIDTVFLYRLYARI